MDRIPFRFTRLVSSKSRLEAIVSSLPYTFSNARRFIPNERPLTFCFASGLLLPHCCTHSAHEEGSAICGVDCLPALLLSINFLSPLLSSPLSFLPRPFTPVDAYHTSHTNTHILTRTYTPTQCPLYLHPPLQNPPLLELGLVQTQAPFCECHPPPVASFLLPIPAPICLSILVLNLR